jgi:sulfate adenylyltransferase subunit 2
MNYLDELESKSIYIIREAFAQHRNIAMLWSIGKDSTTLLWLCRKAFFSKIPFPIIHIDTSYKFKEIYEFRDKYVKEWGLDLIIARNEDKLVSGMSPKTNDKLECCNELKTNALKELMHKKGFSALLLGIRRDEHGIRAKERYFSPRDKEFSWNYLNQPVELWDQYKQETNQETHVRVHPLLHWTELDVWQYVQRESLPVVELYFAKKGKRYRSIGCAPCCMPVDSKANSVSAIIKELKTTKTRERDGRAQDKEQAYVMQKLRSLGYM